MPVSHMPSIKRLMEHFYSNLERQLLPCMESENFEWFHTLGHLYHLGRVLEEEWAMRPEFDQDENVFSSLGQECLDRARAECLNLVGHAAKSFILAIEPWLTARVRGVLFVIAFELTLPPSPRIGYMSHLNRQNF